MRYALALLSALAIAAPALPAAAQVNKSQGDERARFKAAQQLYDKGDFTGALEAFRAIASPNARLYAGRCLRELKKLPEAYEELTVAIREANARAATEPRYAETRDAASTERAALVPKLGLVVIAVTDRPAGLVVKISGQPVSPDHLGESVAVAPGAVIVDASAPGRESFRKELAIGAGASELLAVSLPIASARPVSDEVPRPRPDSPARPIGGVRTAGFVVAGLGVLGWGTFAVAGLMANSKYRSVYAACGGVRCADPAQASEISAGRTLDTAANLGLATGIAGVAGGTVMILLGGPSDKQVIVNASPTGVWVGLRRSF
jgi:hypothetical protein